MNSFYTICSLFILILFYKPEAIAQKDIVIQINHFLNEAPFSYSQDATTNLEHPFDISRLEYYLSKISVIHDGGQELELENVYVLADAGSTTIIEANGLNLSNIEGVSFHVGVDEANNHSDPATWPTDHPLYPKFPSMHWGWTAGYRFVAMEGFTGPSVNSLYQFHGLGDKNYFKTSILNASIESNGKHYIFVDADYAKSLQDMNMSTGVISHGETGEAKQVLLNFNNHVFTAGSAPSAAFLESSVKAIKLFPNPVTGTTLFIEGLDESKSTVQVNILDIRGKKLVQQLPVLDGMINISSISNPGLYMIQILQDAQPISTQRFSKF